VATVTVKPMTTPIAVHGSCHSWHVAERLQVSAASIGYASLTLAVVAYGDDKSFLILNGAPLR